MPNRLLPPDQIPTQLWRRPGGELSLPADLANRYRQVLTERQWLNEAPRFVQWDACDAQSTTELLHTWMEHAPDCRQLLVVAANCSGFLQSDGKFKETSPNLEQIFRWAKARRSDVVWVEPQTSAARRGLLPRLVRWVEQSLRGLFHVRAGDDSNSGFLAEAICLHPLKQDTFPVHLSLVRFEQNDGGAG